jgi:hypothetical protein
LQQSGHRGVASVDQLFWIDETGCNRHTLLRRHGRARRGHGGVRCAGLFDGQKGRNHSVIIAVGRSGGVIARQVQERGRLRPPAADADALEQEGVQQRHGGFRVHDLLRRV